MKYAGNQNSARIVTLSDLETHTHTHTHTHTNTSNNKNDKINLLSFLLLEVFFDHLVRQKIYTLLLLHLP